MHIPAPQKKLGMHVDWEVNDQYMDINPIACRRISNALVCSPRYVRRKRINLMFCQPRIDLEDIQIVCAFGN